MSIFLGHSNLTRSLKFSDGWVRVTGMKVANPILCLAACDTGPMASALSPSKEQAFIGVTTSSPDRLTSSGDLAFIASEILDNLRAGKTIGEAVKAVNAIFTNRAAEQGGPIVTVILAGNPNVTLPD
jgi:hypothetical protein